MVSLSVGRAGSTARSSFANPRPLLLVAHGEVRESLLQPLLADGRIETIDARATGSGWVTLTHRLPGVLMATEANPLEALVYAIPRACELALW